jgi:tetratricopeptide (TPR) repeat protein
MVSVGTRGRWLGIVVLAILLGAFAGGLRWARGRPTGDPIKPGLDAYARGDWETADQVARARLKQASDDAAALRLLARTSVKLEHDSTAVAIYRRLGTGAMAAEDLYLLGVSMTREGKQYEGFRLWEQAESADPNHAETLYMLTQIYSMGDQLARATETGRRLAARAGWEVRAEMLLGKVLLARNDPAGAIASWQRALEHEGKSPGDDSMPTVPRKELARALLQVGRPAEARRQLQFAVRDQSDQEGSWLLSRAYLQEGAQTEALAAWEKAGSFRDDNPLVPEPALYVGSKRCAECHPDIFHSQQRSRHARTFFPVSELGALDLPAPSFADPGQPRVSHTLKRTGNGQVEQETRVEGQVLRAVAEYALGSGDRGQTFVGRDGGGQARELRLSHYHNGASTCWDTTLTHPARPSNAADYVGQPLTEDAVRHCYFCHVADPRAVAEATGPLAVDRGLGCEKCHGPGGNHELAVKAKFPDPAIVNPAMAPGSRSVEFCAQCHSSRGKPLAQSDPMSVRFQGTTLTWSRCFTESKDALDCVTCHDPHRNATTSTAHYEAKCLSCHAGGGRPDPSPSPPQEAGSSEASRQRPCPVNPAKGCIGCHMPAVKNVVPYTFFTDHFIRVHRG